MVYDLLYHCRHNARDTSIKVGHEICVVTGYNRVKLYNLANCHANSAETTCTTETTCMTSPEQIKVMKLEGYSRAVCNEHEHSTMMRSSRFHCPVGVINKPTTDELCISPVY